MTAGARTVLLREISSWLAAELDITADDNHPTIEIVTPERIAAMRYRAFLPDGSTSFVMTERTMSQVKRDIVAVYSDIAQTIYLPDGWTGSTPAESSVLVHEMVHHAQNRAGLKYTCPQARERMAYLAQERWLNLFGVTLETEFDLDPMALLVKTNCMH
jgi:hypothetical protein